VNVKKDKFDKEALYCSFCGKSESEVGHLVSGPDVYICNECIQLCNDCLKNKNKRHP